MAIFKTTSARKSPDAKTNQIKWLMKNLFSSKLNVALTLFAVYLLYLALPPILNWLIFSADFLQQTNDTCTREAACWYFIWEKMDLFMYGLYPQEEYWRPNLVFGMTIVLVVFINLIQSKPLKNKITLYAFAIYPIITFILLYGNKTLGINLVETNLWGGLMLTIVVATVGIVASFPIGILLALGRQSKMKTIKTLSVFYIELIRDIPLITILFMVSVMLPLFFTEDVSVDKLLRALIGITLFQTAYIAEVIRGGLQAIPKGQYEAADAMGLSFVKKMSFVILPQALKISIPNIVGSFIALFKDTTLVLIIGIFDMLAVSGLAANDPLWLGRKTEGYVFVAIVLWIILYSMSRYSKTLEKRFSTEH
jgi:general L-amino acid transport system permease protein